MWDTPNLFSKRGFMSYLQPSQTFLGFDFGTKSLGIAVGQTITQTAQPLTTLKMQAGQPNWVLLDPVVKEWQPHGLIVGLALQPDGSHSNTSKLAYAFGQQLAQRYQQPVYYIEERLTSVAARSACQSRQSKTKAQKTEIDRISAAIILESWLNSAKDEHFVIP